MKFFFKHSTFLLLFLLIINVLSAKTNDTIIDRNFQIEFRASYGFIICHHPEMKYFQSHFPLYELNIQQVTTGRKSWQRKSNYPAVGVSLIYTGIGEMPEIGRAFAIVPHINFNCLKSKRHQLNFNFGIGIGYLTQKHDIIENPKNTFIGSHVNAAINISTDYSYMVTNRLGLSAFIGLTHFSNGSSRSPNNGINIAHAGIGAKYFIQEPKQKIARQPSDNQRYKNWVKENFSFNFAFLASKKDIKQFIGYNNTWIVYNIQFNALKHVTEMSKFGIGLDLVYDQTDEAILRLDGVEFTEIEILKPGINVAYEISFGNTSFNINFGYHLAGKEMSEEHIYQKLGAMQNIWKGLFATVQLTTHFGWADYIGFGIGYRIN